MANNSFSRKQSLSVSHFPLSYTWTENTEHLWACGKPVSPTRGRPQTRICELRRWPPVVLQAKDARDPEVLGKHGEPVPSAGLGQVTLTTPAVRLAAVAVKSGHLHAGRHCLAPWPVCQLYPSSPGDTPWGRDPSLLGRGHSRTARWGASPTGPQRGGPGARVVAPGKRLHQPLVV